MRHERSGFVCTMYVGSYIDCSENGEGYQHTGRGCDRCDTAKLLLLSSCPRKALIAVRYFLLVNFAIGVKERMFDGC